MKQLFSCLAIAASVLLNGCDNNKTADSPAHQTLVSDHKAMEASHDSLEAAHKDLEAAHTSLKKTMMTFYRPTPL